MSALCGIYIGTKKRKAIRKSKEEEDEQYRKICRSQNDPAVIAVM